MVEQKTTRSDFRGQTGKYVTSTYLDNHHGRFVKARVGQMDIMLTKGTTGSSAMFKVASARVTSASWRQKPQLDTKHRRRCCRMSTCHVTFIRIYKTIHLQENEIICCNHVTSTGSGSVCHRASCSEAESWCLTGNTQRARTPPASTTTCGRPHRVTTPTVHSSISSRAYKAGSLFIN